MICKNDNIKELLPAYVADTLIEADFARVKRHLITCSDCAQEAELLSLMTDSLVPDPGEAFWAEMPERIYHAVQRTKEERPQPDLQVLLRRITLPRWALAAAAAGLVVTVSWFALYSTQQNTISPALPVEDYVSQEMAHADPVLRHTSVTIAELTSTELDAVDAWAAAQLSSVAVEAGTNAANIFDFDLNEDLMELSSHDIDRLSTMLEGLKEEG